MTITRMEVEGRIFYGFEAVSCDGGYGCDFSLQDNAAAAVVLFSWAQKAMDCEKKGRKLGFFGNK